VAPRSSIRRARFAGPRNRDDRHAVDVALLVRPRQGNLRRSRALAAAIRWTGVISAAMVWRSRRCIGRWNRGRRLDRWHREVHPTGQEATPKWRARHNGASELGGRDGVSSTIAPQ
jgi:hypothetical protein